MDKAVSPKMELILLSGTRIFVAAMRGNLHLSWLWWPVGLMPVSSLNSN